MALVCATNFSAVSLEALRATAALASRQGEREIWLVHVIETGSKGIGEQERADGVLAVEKKLQADAEVIRGGCVAEVRCIALVDDDASHALLEFSEAREASLLVVSSKGHRDSPLFRLGGTSERLARAARIPVLIVRDGQPFEAWAREQGHLKVLLGVDWTEGSDPAIRWVSDLRRAAPCDVVVAHVYYPDEAQRRYGLPGPCSPVEPNLEIEGLLKRDLTKRVASLVGEGEIVLRPKLALGRMGDHLLEVAEATHADLIVTGNHRRRGPTRLVSVSNVALHFSRASVALVPTIEKRLDLAAPQELPGIRRVLVATDLSPFSNHAIPRAYQLVAASGGEVTLLHVISDEAALNVSEAGVVTLLRSQIPESAPRNNILTRTEVVRSGDAARAICEASDRLEADVVFLASHGRSGVKRALLGSVAEGVLRLGHRPLFIVRPHQS